MNVAVTTSTENPELIAKALKTADELSLSYIPRKKRSIEKLRQDFHLAGLLVIEVNRIVFKTKENLIWHPGMAVHRLKSLKKGKIDPMIKAMGIFPGAYILDCTLGFGADALVAAYATGASGFVTGLEASPIIAYLTKQGMASYSGVHAAIKEATKRICIHHLDYEFFLVNQPDNTYDIVYFDPMFRRGMYKSSSINAIRDLANHQPLKELLLKEALRVCRYRVVMKGYVKSQEFNRLASHYVVGGKYSPIAYVVWEKLNCEV